MGRKLKWIAVAALLLVFAGSGGAVLVAQQRYAKSQQVYAKAAEEFTTQGKQADSAKTGSGGQSQTDGEGPLTPFTVDFEKLQEIRFEKPDRETFRGLALAYQAGREGGTVPTVFNAANEAAVRLFLQRKISYLQIVELIERAMEGHRKAENPSVERILEAEAEAEEFVLQAASGMR